MRRRTYRRRKCRYSTLSKSLAGGARPNLGIHGHHGLIVEWRSGKYCSPATVTPTGVTELAATEDLVEEHSNHATELPGDSMAALEDRGDPVAALPGDLVAQPDATESISDGPAAGAGELEDPEGDACARRGATGPCGGSVRVNGPGDGYGHRPDDFVPDHAEAAMAEASRLNGTALDWKQWPGFGAPGRRPLGLTRL